MNNLCKIFFAFIILIILPKTATCQLAVTPAQPAAILASKLAGPGITILSPTLTCATVANGTFISVSTPLVLDSGILLTTGRSIQTIGAESFLANTNNGTAGDPALAVLAGAATFDACVLQFDFVPNGDTISFNYQFGSEEYINSTCGPYNDAFAFFISGPGIAGTQNMALVPGTNIPVTVNSVNSGIPGSGYSVATCNAMGAGSPFTSFFYNNFGGTQLTYRGFTTKLTAIHEVTPCDTYHLKIAVCDAGNRLYDSGVFIEAGSLKTNSYRFDPLDSVGTTVNGVPHTIVKGCAPTDLNILCGHTSGAPQTVHFLFGGTGIHGIDYSAPDSATINPGDTSVLITIAGLPTTPSGTKTITIYLLSPFSCGIADSVVLNILDSPSAYIITPDTTICAGASFQIRTTGTPGLTYNWTPPLWLSSTTVMQPISTPAVSVIYSMTATLVNSGCPAMTDEIAVTVINSAISILTADTFICKGEFVNIRVSGDPTLNYNWSPGSWLSNPSIQNPVATPLTTTTYIVTATGPGSLCPSTDSFKITVSDINISLFSRDTIICRGDSYLIHANGNAGPIYSWTPATSLNNPAILQPTASPSSTTIYSLTASWPGSGCPDLTVGVKVTVLDATISLHTPDTTICLGDEVHIRMSGDPALVYQWIPAMAMNNPTVKEPVISPMVNTTFSVTATYGGICFSSAALKIVVANPIASVQTKDSALCVGASILLHVSGDPSLDYSWWPASGVSDIHAMQPVVSPEVPTNYIMTATVPGTPCSVSDQVFFDVKSTQLANVTASTTIPFGSSIQLNADSSLFYTWAPNDGSLSNPNISNPVATPLASTTYTVYGLDDHGCRTTAFVTINVMYDDDVFIPDAFTPNGDGLNDVFRVVRLGYNKLVSINIFNRWGDMVYRSENGDNTGWDGLYNTIPQEMGVYFYQVIISRPNGTQKHYKGDVTLIR